MPQNGHIEWAVKYAPGTLLAKGFNNGKEIIKSVVETTGNPAGIQLIPDRTSIKADGEDVSVITVRVNDAKGLNIPDANNEITFSMDGPGKIIGVGNGDPASHEPDRFIESVSSVKISRMRELVLKSLESWPEAAANASESDWKPAFRNYRNEDWKIYKDSLIALRGSFDLPDLTNQTIVNLFAKNIANNQSVYINGHLLAANISRNDNQSFKLDPAMIQKGKNEFVVVGKRFRKSSEWDEPNTNPGVIQVIVPAESWKRKAFNGLAQVIVQTSRNAGEINLTAKAEGLIPAILKLSSNQAEPSPTIENLK